jgi:uncharacterized phage infection (PIP) family protein YhgE
MKKNSLIPILATFGALFLILIVTFPMLSMEVKDIPVGIVSLDGGMESPMGSVNVGEKIINNLTQDDHQVIDWQIADNEKELKDNMDNGKYYATFLIPKNFTVASAMGGDAPIQVTINQGKNPMVTSIITAMITAMKTNGMNLQINNINEIDTSAGMRAMLLPMMMLLFTFVSSLIAAFTLTKYSNLELSGKRNEKIKKYLLQLGYILFLSFVIGFVVLGIISGITGISFDLVNVGMFLTILSFALMLLVNGSINLFGKKGLAIPIILFIFGMGLMTVPFEFLPSWHQLLIGSWEPLRFIGEGMREVLYQNGGLWNTSSISLIILAFVGIVLSSVKIFKANGE